MVRLGVWAAEGVDAKGGPSEDSFCRVCRPIAAAMGQKAGKKWTAAAVLQPRFPHACELPNYILVMTRICSNFYHGKPTTRASN